METKANYLLIGLFTLAGILGSFAFLLWFAMVEADRQISYYDILFEDVSGLSAAGDVRYNGLPVGQVVGLELDDADSSKVRIRIEVAAETPVNSETVAKLQSQGVTGVSYVGLSGGSLGSTPLPEGAVITSERSAIQSVLEGAPVLLERAVSLLENVNEVFNPENRAAIDTILGNLATSSARLEDALADFEGVSNDLGQAARQIGEFTERLDVLADTADTALSTTTATMETVDGAFAEINRLAREDLTTMVEELQATATTANRVIDEVGTEVKRLSTRADEVANNGNKALIAATESFETATDTMAAAQTTIKTVQRVTNENLVPVADDFRTMSQTANRFIEKVGGEVSRVVGRIDDIAATGTVTLNTATETLTKADEAIAGLDQFRVEQLVPLVEGLRETTQVGARVIDKLGMNSERVATRIVELAEDSSVALNSATQTFQNADVTLTAVNTAMASAATTLDTANETFTLATAVIQSDLDPIITDIRRAAEAFTTSVIEASQDIDKISSEVLAASQAAANFVGNLDDIVEANRRQVSEFLRLGLPEIARLTEDARVLITRTLRLVTRVERDPARFLLGTQASDYRR